MMKINRSYFSKKTWLISGALVLLLLAGVGTYALMNKRPQPTVQKQPDSAADRAVNYDEPTDQQVNLGNETKKQTIEKNTGSDSEATHTNITITASNISDNKLHIRTLIDDIDSTGKCELTLTNSNNTNESITETAETYNLPSSSTCKGFDIALDRLASSNSWTIHVAYTSAGILKGEVTKKINLTEQG